MSGPVGTRSAPPGRAHRLLAPAAVIGGLTLATVALRLRDPHEQGSWGICPTAALGFACPGCGGLRAVNDLTHGDVAAAASSNLLFVLAVPFIVAGLLWWVVARWRGTSARLAIGSRWIWIGAAVAVAFAVLRNLPGSWLAP